MHRRYIRGNFIPLYDSFFSPDKIQKQQEGLKMLVFRISNLLLSHWQNSSWYKKDNLDLVLTKNEISFNIFPTKPPNSLHLKWEKSILFKELFYHLMCLLQRPLTCACVCNIYSQTNEQNPIDFWEPILLVTRIQLWTKYILSLPSRSFMSLLLVLSFLGNLTNGLNTLW